MKERGKKQSQAEPPRRGGARAVGDMVPSVGGNAFRRFGFVQSSIVSRWREIVGPRYADVSTPESIRFPVGKKQDGMLTLMVDSAHAPMMQHVTPLLIERVNRFFGYAAVARVTMRQGRITAPEPRTAAPNLRPVPAMLGDSLRDVADPELRACLAALAGAVAASSGPPLFEEERP
ncbi:MAG: DUF721 domain-containing protein [Sphingomonadaceae bacterium]